MCTTSVSPYLLSSVYFKWHMCIVKRHTYLWGVDKQPNTNTGFFSGYQGWSIVVILNTTRGTWHWKAHYMRMTRDNCVFHCECQSLAISSLPLNLKWGMSRRSGYTNICDTKKVWQQSVDKWILSYVSTWPIGLLTSALRKPAQKLDLHQTWKEHTCSERHRLGKNSVFIANFGFCLIWPCLNDSDGICHIKWR